MNKTNYFAFHLKILRIFSILPREGKSTLLFCLQSYFLCLPVLVSSSTTFYGIFRQIVFELEDVEVILDGIIGLVDVMGFLYMRFCFLKNLKNIQKIFNIVSIFEIFCSKEELDAIENKIQQYTKFILLYCLMGNIMNVSIPLLNLESCRALRPQTLLKHDPCGVLCRCYFPMDVSEFPNLLYVFLLQFYTALVVTMTVLIITMTLIAVLIYAIDQLKYCRKLLRDVMNSENVDESLIFIIKYHIKITEFSQYMNKAFNEMMLIHVTSTSCVISFLGFKIVTADNSTDALRFSLHLCGWLMIVLIVCVCGQLLINESTEFTQDVYFLTWYKMSIKNQMKLKMIIMRAQYPLQLSAANLGDMSLPTFLKIIKTAYSYFALLLKIKD